jgi:hypothetical protein
MKLKGSLTEQKIREELIASQRAVLEQGTYPKLTSRLRDLFRNIHTAFVLAWTPEQLEDIFDVLVDGQQVVSLEIPKFDAESTVSVQTAQEYARALRGRPNVLRLTVAMDLAHDKANWFS